MRQDEWKGDGTSCTKGENKQQKKAPREQGGKNNTEKKGQTLRPKGEKEAIPKEETETLKKAEVSQPSCEEGRPSSTRVGERGFPGEEQTTASLRREPGHDTKRITKLASVKNRRMDSPSHLEPTVAGDIRNTRISGCFIFDSIS